MRDNFTNPIVVVAPAPAVAPISLKDYIQQNKKIEFKSTEEYCYYITHKMNNFKQKNGRIYLDIDEADNLIAISVSPYSKTFDDNIEEKIKPLVLALRKKRYLTYSSCMGHGLDFRRFVGLAFCDEASRQYVADKILSLKLPGVKVNFHSTVSNSKVVQNQNSNLPEFTTYSVQEKQERAENPDYELETYCFNVQFHRKYKRYFFLEIVILDAIPYKYEGVKKEFEKVFLRIYKIFFWDYLTKKITDLIVSQDFKQYSY